MRQVRKNSILDWTIKLAAVALVVVGIGYMGHVECMTEIAWYK